MTQNFINAVRDAYDKGALALKTEIRRYCDHLLANGKSAVQGMPGFTFCDICGTTGNSEGPPYESMEKQNARLRKALEDAPHDAECTYIYTLKRSMGSQPRTRVEPCDCWKSRIPEAGSSQEILDNSNLKAKP